MEQVAQALEHVDFVVDDQQGVSPIRRDPAAGRSGWGIGRGVETSELIALGPGDPIGTAVVTGSGRLESAVPPSRRTSFSSAVTRVWRLSISALEPLALLGVTAQPVVLGGGLPDGRSRAPRAARAS